MQKSDTNTQTNVHICLPCLLVLFSRKVHRYTVQMFSGTLPLSRVHPRAKPAALPRKDNIEPIILSTVDADSKVMSRYMFLTYRCTPSARAVSDMKDKRICQSLQAM